MKEVQALGVCFVPEKKVPGTPSTKILMHIQTTQMIRSRSTK